MLTPSAQRANPQPISDEDLLSRAAAGDRDAYWTLYQRYSARMFGLLIRIMNNRTDAEDALQDAALHLWRNAGAYKRELGSASAWILMITRSRAIDAIRKRRRAVGSSDLLDEELNAPAAGLVSKADPEPAGRLPAAIEQLPEEQRTAIHLAFERGLTREQIAALLNIPVGTVKTRVRAGVRRLAELLGPARGETA